MQRVKWTVSLFFRTAEVANGAATASGSYGCSLGVTWCGVRCCRHEPPMKSFWQQLIWSELSWRSSAAYRCS